MDNTILLMDKSNLKKRREEMEKKYKDATDRCAALTVINNNITQFTNYFYLTTI